jgi:nucleotide-binding universal stress UspA family protein
MPKSPIFVVPVDFSRDMEAVVSAALALARHSGAEVHLLEVPSPRGHSILEDARDVSLDGRVRSQGDWSRVKQSIRATERGAIEVRTVAHRGDATKIIPSYVQLVKAGLLVIGQHYGTPRWRRSTRVVSTLSRVSPAPVLVLPRRSRSDKTRSFPFRHIVSAVDFTVASAVAVRTVVDLMRRTGARLTLVHTLTDVPRQMVFSGGEALRVARNLRAHAAQVAERIRRKVPADVRLRADARVATGDPHRGILDIATEVDADLIVMGIPARSRFDEALFGSTLRQVLRRTTVPVLILPVPAGAYKWLDVRHQRLERRLPGRTAAE